MEAVKSIEILPRAALSATRTDKEIDRAGRYMFLFCSGRAWKDAMNDKADADGHLKRIACQVYTQLPEDKREALLVLRYIRQIIFCLGEEWETVSRSAPILPFSLDRKDQAGFPAVLRAAPNDRRDIASRE